MISRYILLATGLLGAGTSLAADAVKVIPPAHKSLSTEGGRFVFGQISEYQRDQFLLDTVTGRVWRVVSYTPTDAQGNPLPGAQKRDVLQSLLFLDRQENTSEYPISEPRQQELDKEFGEWLKKQKSK